MSIVRREEIPEDLEQYEVTFFILNILSHKWTFPILVYTREPISFNHLQRRLHVSHTVLSKNLKYMEGLMLVKRTVITETNPPTVLYSLTEYGTDMLDQCLQLSTWKEYEAIFPHHPPKEVW